MSLEVEYVGAVSRKVWFNYDYFGGAQYAPGATESSQSLADRYPYLTGKVSGVFVNGTPDNALYHGLQVQFNRKMSHGLQFTSSFTYSRAEDANHWPVENFAVPRGRWGRSDSNFPLNSISSFIYQPDFRYGNRVASLLLRGWELAGVLQFESGKSFTIHTGTDNLVNSYFGSRPLQLKDPKLDSHRSRPAVMAEWFDTAAFVNPGIGKMGNTGVDTLQSPGLKNLNASLLRNFEIMERLKFELHFDTFNTMNWVNLGGPDSTMTDPNFGKITSAGSMRQLQLGGKLVF